MAKRGRKKGVRGKKHPYNTRKISTLIYITEPDVFYTSSIITKKTGWSPSTSLKYLKHLTKKDVFKKDKDNSRLYLRLRLRNE